MPLHNSHIALRRTPFFVPATYRTPKRPASAKIHFLQANTPVCACTSTANNASLAPPYALSPDIECATKPHYQLGPRVPLKTHGMHRSHTTLVYLRSTYRGRNYIHPHFRPLSDFAHSLLTCQKAPCRTPDLIKPLRNRTTKSDNAAYKAQNNNTAA